MSMTTHTVNLGNCCSCGKGFTKPFGLRVHQRTCQHWNEPHPREDAAAPVSATTHRRANVAADCGCLWFQGRHIENDERVAVCPQHAPLFPALPQTKFLTPEPIKPPAGALLVEEDYCYRCGTPHYVSGQGRTPREAWEEEEDPHTGMNRTHHLLLPISRDQAIARSAGAMLDYLGTGHPMGSNSTPALELLAEAADYVATWVGSVLERRRADQLDLLDELEG